MNMRALLYPLIASGYVLLVIVAVLLVRTYRRTHDSGFLWLGAQSRMTIQAVVATLQQVSSLVFLLIAVLQLGKMAGLASH
jgi:hypothetical protein